MEPGESHSHLRLDADHAHHGEIAALRDGIVEERRLPDSRFAAQHECAGASGSGGAEQRDRSPPAPRCDPEARRHGTESCPIPGP